MKDIKAMMQLEDESINDMRNHYFKNMKDDNFRKIVSSIDLADEIKMKYTSNLEEVNKEFTNCINCSSLSSCKNNIKGFMYTPLASDKTIVFEYRACKFKNKEISDNKYLENIKFFDMTSGLKKACIKDIYTNDKERLEIIKFFKKFLDNYGKSKVNGLYLNGSFGTGKTYLVAALFNELAKRNVESAVVYYPEFLRSLKESFEHGYKEKFNFIKKVPLLLIDDIGAEVVSGWNRDEILGSILQYRMEESLPTFFTSNLTLEELEEHLANTNKGIEKVKARRIIERIKYMTIDLKLVSINRRNV